MKFNKLKSLFQKILIICLIIFSISLVVFEHKYTNMELGSSIRFISRERAEFSRFVEREVEFIFDNYEYNNSDDKHNK